MYLKALKLHGFKSFADPTTLRFEPGVTAIVGPNGCGKSNIADGIRWVLGEQSAKALRGGKMQDVIFEGTDSRRPAQLCEVSLLLTECEKQLGSEFHEIEIMRRVHRDGGSEYFFNGQLCRLKDIQKLFMDTGIGRTSYSIMAQGQIDQILSSKPEERRAVFEEAAGITKYKAQRREAMNKLALTEQNLARGVDVISEVGRQIGSLRRQAAKALRYKRLSYRHRHLSLAHNAHRHGELAGAIAELESKLLGLRSEAEARRESLAAEQSRIETRKAERAQLQQRAQDAQQAVFDLRSQKEAAENAASVAQIKRAGLEDRLGSSRDNLTELGMQLRELSDQVDSGAQDKQEQLTLLGTSDQVFQNRNRELSVAEADLSKSEEELKQTKFSLLQRDSTIARLRTETTAFEVDEKTASGRHQALAEQIDSVKALCATAQQTVADMISKVETAQAEHAALSEAATQAQTEITSLTTRFRDAQRTLQEIDRNLAQRTARLRLLQQMQEKWEGFGAGAKAVLQGRVNEALAGSPAVPLTQGLEVDPAAGKAIEALLGSAVEAIQVTDLATARRVLAHLERHEIGSVALQIPGLRTTGATGAELPAGLVPATTALRNLAPTHPAAALLSACYLADDLNAFLDYWQANPGFGFVAVATRKGEMVDRRGVIFGGHNRRPENSIVQREIDVRETSRALADEQQKHDAQKQVIDDLNAQLQSAEQTLEEKRTALLASTRQTAALQAEQRSAERARDDEAQRLQRMERQMEELAAARADAQARFERAKAGLAEAETQSADERAKIEALETRLVELRTARDVQRDTLAQARLELAERRQKVEVLDRGIADMERRRDQLAEILGQREQEIEVWSEQIAALDRETAGQKTRSAQLDETLAVAREQVEKIRTELSAVEQDIETVEAAQQGLRTAAESAQTELGRNEVKLAEARSRATFIAEDVTREFSEDVTTLDWRVLMWHSDGEPPNMQTLDLDEEDGESTEGGEADSDKSAGKRRRRVREPKGEPTEADLAAQDVTQWDEVKVEVDHLRQRLNSMGAVNLVAIEEYADLKQRHDFLQGQCTDLTNAKAELLAAIDEINRTSQEQFAITFEQIKQNFKYTFETLFGGGVARLDLIEAEDILESGIEITAQPPGTKLKSITLLSGGQKTLTAVALLFALYMVKPSPFCLLDELDAPLDESNIGRFTDLLKKFVNESQFIIITHNKRTVSAAGAIYGVTMEERGVSKTVSMRFNHGRVEAESHTGDNLAEAVRGTRAPANA